MGATSPASGVVGIPAVHSQILQEKKLKETHRTLFVSSSGLEHAKNLVSSYKQGHTESMTPNIWQAKKVVDSTLHPGT